MRQYLTYQHNVQKFFREHTDKYGGVIIPLSIATAFASGTYGFVRALCSRHSGIEYAIDPRSALFQKDWDRKKKRKPHEKMAEVFGAPFTTQGLSRSLRPTDFSDANVLENNVKNCLDFQRQFRLRSEDERKLRKYKDLLGVASLGPLQEPQFLVPPYFQFSSSVGDDWFDICVQCIEMGLQHNDDIPIRPILHFDSWKHVGNWDICLSLLQNKGIRDFWFYPNYFREHHKESIELETYRQCVELAVSKGLQPYVLFGGYFTILMSFFGLCGFGNGVGYGEWRDSGYHRGGTAAIRIYLLKLHRFVDAPVAQSLLDADPEYFGNDTDIIGGYVQAGVTVEEMSLAESLDHFLECRQQEMHFVETQPVSAAIDELAETTVRLKSIGSVQFEKFGKSLERWCETLS